ncbi:MAG: hypothetical protein U0136_00145 [Bdellovibrionota bacterium]
MINIQVDGSALQVDLGGIKTMGDLLELVKSSIDPDTMITAIEFNGQTLSDSDWTLPLNQQTGRTLEISTGTKRAYLSERFAASASILDEIIKEFAAAGDSYRSGSSPDGNAKLSQAVEDLGAFVNWYSSLLSMDPESYVQQTNAYNDQVDGLQKICEQILQQQLYNSWWVLAETIKTRLNPKLEEIRGLCTQLADTVQ